MKLGTPAAVLDGIGVILGFFTMLSGGLALLLSGEQKEQQMSHLLLLLAANLAVGALRAIGHDRHHRGIVYFVIAGALLAGELLARSR